MVLSLLAGTNQSQPRVAGSRDRITPADARNDAETFAKSYIHEQFILSKQNSATERTLAEETLTAWPDRSVFCGTFAPM
jgi:hypothetical protein